MKTSEAVNMDVAAFKSLQAVEHGTKFGLWNKASTILAEIWKTHGDS